MPSAKTEPRGGTRGISTHRSICTMLDMRAMEQMSPCVTGTSCPHRVASDGALSSGGTLPPGSERGPQTGWPGPWADEATAAPASPSCGEGLGEAVGSGRLEGGDEVGMTGELWDEVGASPLPRDGAGGVQARWSAPERAVERATSRPRGKPTCAESWLHWSRVHSARPGASGGPVGAPPQTPCAQLAGTERPSAHSVGRSPHHPSRSPAPPLHGSGAPSPPLPARLDIVQEAEGLSVSKPPAGRLALPPQAHPVRSWPRHPPGPGASPVGGAGLGRAALSTRSPPAPAGSRGSLGPSVGLLLPVRFKSSVRVSCLVPWGQGALGPPAVWRPGRRLAHSRRRAHAGDSGRTAACSRSAAARPSGREPCSARRHLPLRLTLSRPPRHLQLLSEVFPLFFHSSYDKDSCHQNCRYPVRDFPGM